MTKKIIDDLHRIEGLQGSPNQQIPPGMFIVEVATLHFGSPRNEQPIGNFIQAIHLWENIRSTSVTGWIELQDTWNLVRNGIILGQELLYLKFRTPHSEYPVDFTEHPLMVYKIEDLTEMSTTSGTPSQSTLTYKLHLTSPEQIISDRTRISETMQGTCSEMVEKVLTNHLKTKKDIFVEPTKELYHEVIPNKRPFDVITQHLTTKAQTRPVGGSFVPGIGRVGFESFKGLLSDYHFFETSTGFKFQPMQQKADEYFIFTIGTTPATPGYVGTMTTSIQHSYTKAANTQDTIRTGMWGARQIRHSASTKSFTVTESNYHRSLYDDRYSYVNETPVYNANGVPEPNILGEPKRISDWPGGRIEFGSSASRNVTNINKNNGKPTFPWHTMAPSVALMRIMQLQHVTNYQLLDVRLHGISGLEAGMCIMLRLPDIGEGSGYLGGSAVWTNRYDNLWVITSLSHHILTQGNKPAYFCDLTLSNLMTNTEQVLPSYDGTGILGPNPIGVR